MSEAIKQLAERLRSRFPGATVQHDERVDQVTLVMHRDALRDTALTLRDAPEFAFRQLIDLCGVDYLAYGEDEWATQQATARGFSRGVRRYHGEQDPDRDDPRRFAVVYHLLSLDHNQRLRLRVFAEDADFPVVASVVDIWPAADWFEREAFDLFGIHFDGHPDLRRLLTDYGFIGHPFRKDFPLIGNVEVRYDPDRGRVVYEPVTSIEPRVLVPKVIRAPGREQPMAPPTELPVAPPGGSADA